ncbi:hypothetical protein MWN33_17535 [Starkeya koreensis]|uniref:DUF4189 domain-containing protein n=1 Tax=Ancylobacter koreensis TaxID=266121 RepID=A0ABT0DRT7_9HYPH|nr:hypothetical protein [Ancylobacter koreensis]MCK0209837.1 hypothetical protein [Ancylobacter koreensis]
MHPVMFPAMHPLRSALLALALCASPGLAMAQDAAPQGDRIFLIDASEGYGVDTCLAAGSACGQAMADAWCRVHDYQQAVGFGAVASDAAGGVSAAANVRTACYGTTCQDAVAITCTR